MYFGSASKLLRVMACFCMLGSFQLVQAGWMDDVKSVGQQLVDEVTKSTANKPKESPKQTVREPVKIQTQQPKYDSALVADIQRELNRAGYGVGTVDGAYGPGTSGAIQRFQRDQRISADGVPTHSLLVKLKAHPGQTVASANTSASINPKRTTQNTAATSQNTLEAIKASLNKFEFQGITLGMTEKESKSILVGKGFSLNKGNFVFSKEEKGVKRTLRVNWGKAHTPNQIVTDIMYEQHYSKTANLDFNVVENKIIKKYGTPSHSFKMGNNINIIYFIPEKGNSRDKISFDMQRPVAVNTQSIYMKGESSRLAEYLQDLKNRKEQADKEAQEQARKQQPEAEVDF